MRGERAFRILADRLAARGVSVLRLDYPATGNSTGDALRAGERDPDLVQRWCQSIIDAAAHATQLVPGAEIVLVGRRLGALLVLQASRALPSMVKGCVLWDPPTSGRSFVRELRLRESARFDHRYAEELAREHPGIALQWEGHRFDRRTVEAMERLTLDGSAPSIELVDVIAHEPERAVASLARASGAELHVTGHRAADAAFDWSVYDGPAIPEQCLAIVERCIADDAPLVDDDDAVADDVRVPSVAFHGNEHTIMEELVRFGAAGAMFGVSTTRVSHAPPTTAALILPTGIEPSSGYGDMWARFARRAAEQGMATLRIDWRGNGESRPHPGGEVNVSYGAGRSEDVVEGIAWLRAHFPGAGTKGCRRRSTSTTWRPRWRCSLPTVSSAR
ncbi:MAG: alpha/beta fold hydrolase [Gemmatimonadetes bacterium]|nr:alpha/beta fold hydrolase [Gemmatimonadota bacterium]